MKYYRDYENDIWRYDPVTKKIEIYEVGHQDYWGWIEESHYDLVTVMKEWELKQITEAEAFIEIL